MRKPTELEHIMWSTQAVWERAEGVDAWVIERLDKEGLTETYDTREYYTDEIEDNIDFPIDFDTVSFWTDKGRLALDNLIKDVKLGLMEEPDIDFVY